MRIAIMALSLLTTTAHADMDVRLDQVSQAIEARLANSARPGIVIGITDRQQLRKVIVHGYSDLKAKTPLTPDSRFALGSISKSFTAVALMQLAEEGKFNPSAPIVRYVPSFRIESKFAPITGHDLLSHTSGLMNYLTDVASSRAVLISLRDFTPTYAPGAHWAYSNTGFQVLGYALENIESAKYDAIIRRRILTPLGMNSTTGAIDDEQRNHMTVSYMRWPYDGHLIEAPWYEYLAADGSLISTVADMAAYTRFYLNRGQGPKQRVLSEKAYATLTTPVLDNYAYGLFVKQDNGHTTIGHSGGIAGFSTHFEAHLEEGFGVVFLTNGGMEGSLRPWVVELARAAFANQPLPAPPPPDPDPLTTPLIAYVGHFEAPPVDGKPRVVNVRLSADQLMIEGTDGQTHLMRMGVDAFRARAGSSDTLGYFFARAEDKPDGAVIGVSHGNDWYGIKSDVALRVPPKEFAAYVGHYLNNGPEGPTARIFVRDGNLFASLFLEEPMPPLPLSPLGQGVFRIGKDDFSPERLKFDAIIEGHAQRLLVNGVPLYRRETP